MSDAPRRRYALVGTGARAQMFTSSLVHDHADVAELVALADPNPGRIEAHQADLARWGRPPVPSYPATAFGEMLERERVDAVIVTTVDRYHDEYLVAALDAGRDAVTEKPMTVDVPRCRRILDAVRSSGRRVTVTFNYRYNPVHEEVRRIIASGEIGEVGSVHFEWLLDVRHGADYFRRWHRDKANSGGLLVHKASHHFDLVNWWLGDEPADVYAAGRLFFYGADAGREHGYAGDDRFTLPLTGDPRMRALYVDAAQHDGYRRDQDVFAPGVTIEDDLAVLVRYAGGASLSYHLTAYAPWEGYRVMINGSRGRLELEVVETDHVSPDATGVLQGPEPGFRRLLVRPLWAPPREVELPPRQRAGHGGADARMLADLFRSDLPPDPLGRTATDRDGARALLVGLAANESIATGHAVRVADLLGASL